MYSSSVNEKPVSHYIYKLVKIAPVIKQQTQDTPNTQASTLFISHEDFCESKLKAPAQTGWTQSSQLKVKFILKLLCNVTTAHTSIECHMHE